MEVDSLRVMTAVGAFVSFGTAALFGWHAWFFARRWRTSATARYMATLFFLMATGRCMDVLFSGMMALGAESTALLIRTYPLWLGITIATAACAHFMVRHFEGIIETQRAMMADPGSKEWK